MVKDKIIGFIPKVVIDDENYAIFVTTKRLVFILTGKARVLLGYLLGGALGAFIARETAKDDFDFSDFDLDAKLAEDKKNMVFMIKWITEVKLKREWGSFYPIKIYGLNAKDKVVKLISGYFVLPKEMKRYYLQSGYKEKEILTHYARTNQDILVSALGDKVTVRYFL